MKIESPKSLFNYTDEEWPGVEMILMRGAGRRYKDPVEAIAAVVSLKKVREAGRKWFAEKEGILNSHKEKLIKEILIKNKRDYLTPKEQKEVEREVDTLLYTLNTQERYRCKLPERDKEFAELYYFGYNGSDFIFDELEKTEKAREEEKNYHMRLAQEMYDFCKRNKKIMPDPIEDYFLKKRSKPSAEEIREWYLENKPKIKIHLSNESSKPKWELGIWGYIILGILGVLFLLAVYFLKWDIIPVTVGVILLLGLWIFWFGVLKRSLWELIALYIFLGYLLLHFSK